MTPLERLRLANFLTKRARTNTVELSNLVRDYSSDELQGRRRGMALGAGIGAPLGALAGVVGAKTHDSGRLMLPSHRRRDAAVGTGLGALWGLEVGGLFGGSVNSKRRSEAWHTQHDTELAAAMGNAGLGTRVPSNQELQRAMLAESFQQAAEGKYKSHPYFGPLFQNAANQFALK